MLKSMVFVAAHFTGTARSFLKDGLYWMHWKGHKMEGAEEDSSQDFWCLCTLAALQMCYLAAPLSDSPCSRERWCQLPGRWCPWSHREFRVWSRSPLPDTQRQKVVPYASEVVKELQVQTASKPDCVEGGCALTLNTESNTGFVLVCQEHKVRTQLTIQTMM